MNIRFLNDSDNVNYTRNCEFNVSDSNPITIMSALSKVDLTNGQILESFTGHFPRLVQNENRLRIRANQDLSVIITTPVARWIT